MPCCCADTRDVTNLLSRAGFTLTTVDIDEVRVAYPSMWELMDDLRDMGESNAIAGRSVLLAFSTPTLASSLNRGMFLGGIRSRATRSQPLRPSTKVRSILCLHQPSNDLFHDDYVELHGNEDGTIPATFQVIYMVGPTGHYGPSRADCLADRVEAGTKPAEAAGAGNGPDKSQGCPVTGYCPEGPVYTIRDQNTIRLGSPFYDN